MLALDFLKRRVFLADPVACAPTNKCGGGNSKGREGKRAPALPSTLRYSANPPRVPFLIDLGRPKPKGDPLLGGV